MKHGTWYNGKHLSSISRTNNYSLKPFNLSHDEHLFNQINICVGLIDSLLFLFLHLYFLKHIL